MRPDLAERLAQYTLVPETIFAYRFSEEAGWRLEAWECTKEAHPGLVAHGLGAESAEADIRRAEACKSACGR